jgi:hypothetical protein
VGGKEEVLPLHEAPAGLVVAGEVDDRVVKLGDAVAASCELPVRRAGRTVAMPGEVAELSWVREPVDLVPLAAGPAPASAVSGRSG